MQDTDNEIKDILKQIKAGLNSVPIYHKVTLTYEEAAEYYNVGINKLREICYLNPELRIMNGKKTLIKRQSMEDYLIKQDKI